MGEKKKKQKMTLARKRSMKGFMFIVPWLIGFLAFYLRSLIMTVQFSLSDLTVNNGGGYTLKYVGLDNFLFAFRGHGTFK